MNGTFLIAKVCILFTLIVNSLLSNIETLRYVVKAINATAMVICQSKLCASMLNPEISLGSYKILRYDRNRQRGSTALLCEK